MGLSAFDEYVLLNTAVSIKAADTTTKQALVSWSAPNARIDAILVTNTDVIAHVVDLWVSRVFVDFLLGSLLIPAGQGTGGTPSLNLLTGCLPSDVDHVSLTSTDILYVNSEVAVTGAYEVDFFATGGTV